MASHIPHIDLLCMHERFIDAFHEASQIFLLPKTLRITIHNCSLGRLPPSVQFDTIVSPANSYGLLDGAFDDAISRALSPRDDYFALTRVAQARLYDEWHGFAPPGSCTLARIPDDLQPRSKNVWGCKRIALCPTMRTPTNVEWDREVAYECIWALLCKVDRHNRALRDGKAEGREDGDEEEIQNILITPMATGVGMVSPHRWAEQMVLAIKHFEDSSENVAKWKAMNWDDAVEYAEEVEATWDQQPGKTHE